MLKLLEHTHQQFKTRRQMDSDPATRPSVIDRTRSDQLEVLKSLSRTASTLTETEFSSELNGGARKSKVADSSRSPAKRGSYHIRKSRSTQLNKVDLEEVSNAALSRASSASLGFSFSFTGFTPPPQGVADLNSSLSDDDISPGN